MRPARALVIGAFGRFSRPFRVRGKEGGQKRRWAASLSASLSGVRPTIVVGIASSAGVAVSRSTSRRTGGRASVPQYMGITPYSSLARGGSAAAGRHSMPATLFILASYQSASHSGDGTKPVVLSMRRLARARRLRRLRRTIRPPPAAPCGNASPQRLWQHRRQRPTPTAPPAPGRWPRAVVAAFVPSRRGLLQSATAFPPRSPRYRPPSGPPMRSGRPRAP